RFSPSTSSGIARTWSPRIWKSVTRLKRSYTEGMKIPHRTTPLFRLGRLLIRREVAAAGEDLGAFEIGTGDADFDLAPRAFLLGVRRAVGEAVLRADLCDDLVVARLDVLHRRREERLAAGRLGNLLQV